MKKRHKEYLEIIKELLFLGSYISDDKLVARASKTHPLTKQKLPLDENYWKSDVLEAVCKGTYFNVDTKAIKKSEDMTAAEISSDDWKESKEYRLRPSAVNIFSIDNQVEILKRIRLSIHGNQLDIILSGVLTAQPGKSRLRLLADTVEALVRAKIIKGKLSEESYRTRAYKILSDYFELAEYEIRIDTSRNAGRSFYKYCREHSKFETDFDNTAYLTSPNKSAYKQTGYRVIAYDRALKPDVYRKLHPSYFPIRLELRVRGRLLKGITVSNTIGDACKGSSVRIITRLSELIVSKISTSVKRIGAIQQFDLFCNGKHKGISSETSLNDLIANRTFQKHLNMLHKLKSERGEPVFDVDDLLKFHGHDMKRYYSFDQI